MEVLHSYLRFDGKDSRDFGLSIEQPEITKKPKRKVNRDLRTGAVRRLSGRRGRLRKRGAILPGMVQEGGARSGSAVGG